MNMISDKNLWFLEQCSNEQLSTLFDILTLEQNGEYRRRERLSNCLEAQIYEGDYYKYSDRIALELQYLANETVGDFLRQFQLPYLNILEKIFNVLQIDFDENTSVIQLEETFINTLCDRSIGLKNSGVKELPFDVLLSEGMTTLIRRSSALRVAVPAVLYIALLRLDSSKNINIYDYVDALR
ncbi:DUF3944 domain-containing protein [Flammeovirga kamogawensis]|uniref:DUF3944 domain-containing protein n=2 Tax=Flammeovirga kamogawensis TaxID=373891 RepID=A0ABX8H1R6_9BACT|nr:DUF3944 domain-containing protein [Flammeovirga kamogawensis]QWG09776.1 DUF3944 domain-containing protein [Flammeovirga kamogawensis]TRX65286.1 DUF3944 domain-containing protein [Flammeovirga kamogawensis]